MSENSIAALVVICLIAGAILASIWHLARRHDILTLFNPNDELKHFAPRKRHAWFSGIVAALAFIALTSWLSQQDERADRADREHAKRLTFALKVSRCRKPNAPLEVLAISVGMQADGKQPTVACLYIKNDLPIVPKLQYEKLLVADAQM